MAMLDDFLNALTLPPAPPADAPRVGMLEKVLNAMTPQKKVDAPPSTNDPMASEPVLFSGGVPLRRPRPPEAGANPAPPASFADRFDAAPLPQAVKGDRLDRVAPPLSPPIDVPSLKVAAPFAMAPDAQDSATLPPNATPTIGQGVPGGPQAPAAEAPGPMSGLGDKIGNIAGSIWNKLTDPNTVATRLAIGAGFAGAPSFGTGISRASAAAIPAMAADRAFQQKQEGIAGTYRALIGAGVDKNVALAASFNPEVLKTIAPQLYNRPDFGVIGTDQYGNPIHGFINKATQQVTPATAAGGAVGATGSGPGVPAAAMDLHGDDYLKTLDSAKADLVKRTAAGLSPYPTGFMMKTPFGQWLTQAVGQYEPGVDANMFTARGVLRKDLAKSGNSSMGGILANGDSSFSHLAEFGDSAVALGNYSHDFYGGGNLANAQNYIGNVIAPTSKTKGIVGAARDNLMHYGQESTKFYAATGGGEAERMAALREQNPATASSEEMASYMEKEKSLMLDRFKSKTDQILHTLGEVDGQKEIAKYAPNFEKNIARIDAAIAKLRGQAVQQATPQSSAQAPQQAPAVVPQRVQQNGHIYERQPDGSYKPVQ